ncbi:peptidoglycan-binding domain-containing protein, partial [Arthrospira platensis SPKY2]
MRIGDVGANVANLQRQLNQAGAKPQLIVDGWFGELTRAAVIAFQKKHGISAIGIAGPRTQAALAGLLDPKRIGKSDLARAAKALGVNLA